jgi:cytidylate kinase
VKARSFLGINLNSISISDFFSASIVDDSELFRIQSDAVRNAAAFGSAIFVGRCADYILRNEKRCLNVFISADMSDRIGRIRSDKRIKDADTKSDEEIKELLFKADKKRANYYDYYSFRKWGAARNYDLCVSSSKFGIEGCVEIISRIVETRFNVNI